MDAAEAGPGHHDPRAVWDEYRWEAVIQHQDQQAGEYLALLEHFGDHPNAHNLIARAMGWNYLLTNCRREPDPHRCTACPAPQRRDCRFHQAYFGRARRPSAAGQPTEAEWNARYAQHPVLARAAAFIRRLRRLGVAHGCDDERIDGPVCRMLHQGRCCTAKISAALADTTGPIMLGRVIAYLKIAHQAATACESLVEVCVSDGIIGSAEVQELSDELVAIRADVTDLIGEFRPRLGAMCHRVNP